MKRTLTTIFSILFTTIIFAQDFSAKSKGSFLAGGSIYIDSRTDKFGNDKIKSFTTNITPKVGYFIADNMAAGLELGISTSTSNGGSSSSIDFKSLGVIAFGRYYLNNNIFAELAPGIGTSILEQEISGVTDETKSSFYKVRVGAGYAFFLGNHVAIEPTVNYRWESHKPKGAGSGDQQTISSIFLGIGFLAYF